MATARREPNLRIAAQNNDLCSIRDALKSGIRLDLDACDKDGKGPLHYAAQHGALEVTRLLLDAKADPTLRDKNGSPPLDAAIGS